MPGIAYAGKGVFIDGAGSIHGSMRGSRLGTVSMWEVGACVYSPTTSPWDVETVWSNATCAIDG